MSNIPFRFLQRRTSTSGRTPDVESLLNGELYVQLADETIYFKNDKCQLVSVVTASKTGNFIHTSMICAFSGGSGVDLTNYVSISQTGNLTGAFAPVGNYITINQTGNFVSVLQTGNFITTSMTGIFGGGSSGSVDLSNYVTTSQTGNLGYAFAPTGDYVIASQTGNFVTTSQTGAFAPTGDYVIASQTGSFVTTSQTGAFAPTGDYVTIVDGHIPSQYLPSYVDDIEEFDTTGHLYEHSGERGHIYLVSGCNSFWRWGGSQYIEIFGSPGSSDNISEGLTNLYFTAERSAGYVATGSTGSFVTTSQTGVFALSANTGSFVTTSQTGAFAPSGSYVITSQTGIFAPSGSYVTTSQTGIFAPSGSYVTTSQTGAFAPSGSYVITSQTGIFETSGYARTCYVTTGQTGNFGAGNGLGYGQTWQSVSRSINTNYANNTSQPIAVNMLFNNSPGVNPAIGCIVVGAIKVAQFNFSNNSIVQTTLNTIVPTGASYCFYTNGGTISVVELR